MLSVTSNKNSILSINQNPRSVNVINMSLDERFNEAAERVKTLTKRPTDKELLELYALFKQGTFGDNKTSKPGMLDLKGKAKWNTWNEKKGMSQDEAKEKYITFVDLLMEQYKE